MFELQKVDEEFCSNIKVWLHNIMKNSRDQPTADILPEFVIHKILCYLSFKEAAQMTILSKTWLQAWLTHPNLKFTFGSSYENINIVDKIMERYRDGKIRIDKFEFLNIASPKGDLSPLIHKCLSIALQNGVKDLHYTDFTYHSSSYAFPIFKFLAANSLRELVLTYCHLSLSAIHVVNCHSLRKLSLSNVTLDDNMLQTLLTSCPLILNLIILHCPGWKKFEVRNLQKIRSLSIKTNKEQVVVIQAPTLEHLSYFSHSSLEELDIVEYQNLKSLELSCSGISGDTFIERLISKSQFLESLVLVGLASGRFNIIKSESLRVLKIQNCRNRGLIDAPNLVSLEYEGYLIPQLIFAQEPSKMVNFILDSCWYSLDAEWFCRLREFLSNSISWSQVSLHIAKFGEINRMQLKQQYRVATPQVDVLDVNIKSTKDCPAFADALLWSCHPRRLNISSTIKMIIYFIDRLMYMKNSSHSTSHGTKPQLSQLKEVKAYKFDGKYESWHPVELKSGELKTSNPEKMEKFYFLLDW